MKNYYFILPVMFFNVKCAFTDGFINTALILGNLCVR